MRTLNNLTKEKEKVNGIVTNRAGVQIKGVIILGREWRNYESEKAQTTIEVDPLDWISEWEYGDITGITSIVFEGIGDKVVELHWESKGLLMVNNYFR